MLFASQSQAEATLPADAEWSASFGNPGEGGYVVYYRTKAGQRYTISNGSWDALKPFSWAISKVVS